MPQKKILRSAFYALWFVVVPLLLALATIWLLKPADPTAPQEGMGKLRWWVHDQPVPMGIVLFTLFEMVLYRFRYSLPLATQAGVGGRADLPPDLRRDFEHAAQLLDEVGRIEKRSKGAIDKNVPSKAREDLKESLESLRDAMKAKKFDKQAFRDNLEDSADLVERHLGRWRKSELREYAESILFAVGVALILRAFVVQAFKIPSGSMLPTLQLQDHIFVNKFAYGPTIPFTKARIWNGLPPKHGDIIVFEFPDPNPANEREDYIKRVLALPGDELKVENGHPFINGWKVPNCRVGHYQFFESVGDLPKEGELYIEYLGDYAYLTLHEDDRSPETQGPYRVGQNEVWVLGDNRDNSKDSRAWRGVPFPNIRGRALFVWLSFSRSGGVTWDRLLTQVMGRPRLPKEASPRLTEAINECLRKRPSLSAATPPPPRR